MSYSCPRFGWVFIAKVLRMPQRSPGGQLDPGIYCRDDRLGDGSQNSPPCEELAVSDARNSISVGLETVPA
ncbi:hypothetical protein SAMN04488061_1768 [Filomicrobium insigne]|uniref:Uncharacterized protein n=1 Tax=Filomicrobium insigne TaxID=418854 RepID=A0A1H0MRV4_9HYPH|nr:hypothetical protein SAMN04488061_1768 [Filomicrobium insigne]